MNVNNLWALLAAWRETNDSEARIRRGLWLGVLARMACDIGLCLLLALSVVRILPVFPLGVYVNSAAIYLVMACLIISAIVLEIALLLPRAILSQRIRPRRLALALREALSARPSPIASIVPLPLENPEGYSAPISIRAARSQQHFTITPTIPRYGSRSPVAALLMIVLMSVWVGIVVALLGSLLLFPLTSDTTLDTFLNWLPAIYILPFFIGIVAGGLGLWRAIQMRRSYAIRADDTGLSFRASQWSKRKTHIAWSEIKSISCFIYNGSYSLYGASAYTSGRFVYLLDGGRERLTWEVPLAPAPTMAGPYSMPAVNSGWAIGRMTDAQNLALLVTDKSGLPLLDVTAAINQVVRTQWTPWMRQTDIEREVLDDALAVALVQHDQALESAVLPVRYPTRWPKRQSPGRVARKRAREWSISTSSALTYADAVKIGRFQAASWLAHALIPYFPTKTPLFARQGARLNGVRKTFGWLQASIEVIVALAALALLISPFASLSFLHTLAPRLANETTAQVPTYSSQFSLYPTNDWYYHQPTKTDSFSYAYVNGAYQITSSDPQSFVSSWIDESYSDGAELVTVKEQGKADENNLAWVGMMLDANSDGTRFTTFMIDELGDWSLSHYDGSLPADQQWSTPDAGYSDAIHQGQDVANTLLLIRQGNLYFLYVNNALVDQYYDSDHRLKPGGQVGVYLDEGGFVARFTDFELYTLPPQLPSWAR